MPKYGEGLGYEIVKAVNFGEIKEPITYNKIKDFCKKKGFNPSENQMRVLLSNSTENTHSPTYAKYFIRVGRGKYMLHSDYRKSKNNYFWLNIDYESYEWSFSDLKVGRSMTYSNLNEEGGKRRNQSCFESIKVGDQVLAYETGETKAITTICEVVNKNIEDDQIIIEFMKKRDFDRFITLEEMRANKSLKSCNIIGNHRGTLLDIDKSYFDEIVRMLKNYNTRQDYYSMLEEEVKISRKLTREERKKRLQNRENLIPEKVERKSTGFIRNPDVIAEVLERANGICEECGNKAPFLKALDGTPYLEVHHKIRLADGGEDTVDNAVAVCPNCHRRVHFG